MEGHGEAAADVITGGVIAQAVEPDTGTAQHQGSHGKCRNCGTQLSGAYCVTCGQPAHLHRSLVSLGHDILHGVFHFEGKIWRTIPELLFHPGRLTRRYIDGERAKFVSPMALYLFSVFLMFAVFSFTTGALLTMPEGIDMSAMSDWKSNINEQIERIDGEVEAMEEQLEAEDLPAAERARLQIEIKEQRDTREVMEALTRGDLQKLQEFQEQQAEIAEAAKATLPASAAAAIPKIPKTRVNTGNPTLDTRFTQALMESTDNPKLFSYKLKIAGYKYSWALVPLSVPFMWLLFFWRRDIHLYDHAIFVTYSICFMMVFAMMLSIGAAMGLSAAIWGTALGIVPALHLYKQLRGAYGLSRVGALFRLFTLSIMITIVLVVFGIMLIGLGLMG